ncbi:fungal-specific transcription factor domain-containing protein [Phlyctochytrium arcticum]|nr:fungal-specific transcription factor domain-containing protein [Phlyctochytrium arcticum]
MTDYTPAAAGYQGRSTQQPPHSGPHQQPQASYSYGHQQQQQINQQPPSIFDQYHPPPPGTYGYAPAPKPTMHSSPPIPQQHPPPPPNSFAQSVAHHPFSQLMAAAPLGSDFDYSAFALDVGSLFTNDPGDYNAYQPMASAMPEAYNGGDIREFLAEMRTPKDVAPEVTSPGAGYDLRTIPWLPNGKIVTDPQALREAQMSGLDRDNSVTSLGSQTNSVSPVVSPTSIDNKRHSAPNPQIITNPRHPPRTQSSTKATPSPTETRARPTSSGQARVPTPPPTNSNGKPVKVPVSSRRKACEPCRAKKLRCEGQRPHCSTCLKSSQGSTQCVYFADKPRVNGVSGSSAAAGNDIGSPDVKGKRSKSGEVKALEDRMSALEAMLASAIANGTGNGKTERREKTRMGSGAASVNTSTESLWSSTMEVDNDSERSPSPLPSDLPDPAAAAFAAAAASAATGGLPPNPASVDLPFVAAAMTKPWFCDVVDELSKLKISDPAESHNCSGPNAPQHFTPPPPPQDQLPDDLHRVVVRLDLLDFYFKQRHAFSPFDVIHKEAFMKNIHEESPMLLFALYATVCRATDDEKTRNSFDFFFSRARKLVSVHLECPTVSGLQGMLFLSSAAMTQGLMSTAWMYSGMAIRMVQMLCLDMDPADLGITNWAEAETRRRIWWCINAMESLKSVISSRTSALNGYGNNVRDPVPDAIWENSNSDGVVPPSLRGVPLHSWATWLFKVQKLFAKAIEYNREALRKPISFDTPCLKFSELDAELEHLYHTMPDTIKLAATAKTFSLNPASVDPPPVHVIDIFMMYRGALCLLHRPRMMAAYLMSEPHPAGLRSIRIAAESANDMGSIVGVMLTEGSVLSDSLEGGESFFETTHSSPAPSSSSHGEGSPPAPVDGSGPSISAPRLLRQTCLAADHSTFLPIIGVFEGCVILIITSAFACVAADPYTVATTQERIKAISKLFKRFARRLPVARVLGDLLAMINGTIMKGAPIRSILDAFPSSTSSASASPTPVPTASPLSAPLSSKPPRNRASPPTAPNSSSHAEPFPHLGLTNAVRQQLTDLRQWAADSSASLSSPGFVSEEGFTAMEGGFKAAELVKFLHSRIGPTGFANRGAPIPITPSSSSIKSTSSSQCGTSPAPIPKPIRTDEKVVKATVISGPD